MYIYFLLIRLAACFGHRKAKLLVEGQRRALDEVRLFEKRPLRGAVWFHAASVGEFEQARPIIETMRREHPERPIVLTFFSPSGYEMRKNYAQVDLVTYLPFATRTNAKAFIQALQPSCAIFVKYEFWPAYLRRLVEERIPTYLISAIFRPGQLFFRPWGRWYRRLLGCFTTMFVQDTSSQELLAKYGFQQVVVAGDTRFDRVAEISQNVRPISVIEHFVSSGQQPVIVAGSTWPQDERLLAKYVSAHPEVRLILVPHEIDEGHLHEIFQIFQGRYVRFTEADERNIQHVQVLVVDQMGLLSSIYQYGHVAYVGGGFGAGIHNTIEAAVYGLPVLFGPNYQAFREAVGLIKNGCAWSVKSAEELENRLNQALVQHVELGQQASRYVFSELGATERVLKQLTINN